VVRISMVGKAYVKFGIKYPKGHLNKTCGCAGSRWDETWIGMTREKGREVWGAEGFLLDRCQ